MTNKYSTPRERFTILMLTLIPFGLTLGATLSELTWEQPASARIILSAR